VWVDKLKCPAALTSQTSPSSSSGQSRYRVSSYWPSRCLLDCPRQNPLPSLAGQAEQTQHHQWTFDRAHMLAEPYLLRYGGWIQQHPRDEGS